MAAAMDFRRIVRHPVASLIHPRRPERLAPAILIAAEIDPLHSEGKAYGDKLRAAGVPLIYQLYRGVTHEFFGMGAIIAKAKEAETLASTELRTAFAKQ